MSTPRDHRDSVTIRMYRQGLGDCFLLSFPKSGGGAKYHVMIDCGVLLGTTNASARMERVLQDVRDATDGRLDLVVVTHEHWDHVSGFAQAETFFRENVEVEQLWLAWTEDPANAFADELRRTRRRKVEAIRAAADRMRTAATQLGLASGRPARLAGERAASLAGGLDDILDFFGATGDSTEGALAVVRDVARSIRYRRPGERPIALPGLPGVRVFVLGPPDKNLFRRSDPTRSGQEADALDADVAGFEAAFMESGDGTAGGRERGCGANWPFDRCLQVSRKMAREDIFLQTHYGFDSKSSGEDDAGAWRRIDTDWLDAATSLALRLDDDTNNTSLVLAFELIESGRVLLFPGDAQAGNWLSWRDLAWDVDGPAAKVTAEDLLRRTVLFKVGHHASHNATLRAGGLELMESAELTAMIPVSEVMAERKRWAMPFPALLQRLTEKTAGRVLRSDVGIGPKPDHVSPAQWDRFLDCVEINDLWIEYRVPFDA